MVQIAELTKDRSFRNRLILACIGVAVFVSVIYVVVSYRLTSELGVKTELNAMELQARIIHDELANSDDPVSQKASLLADSLFSGNPDLAVYMRVFDEQPRWEYAHQIMTSDISALLDAVSASSASGQGEAEFKDKSFLWLNFQGEDYTILLIQSNTSLERTMSMVGKRLSIVSIIVFWIATWLALTLSSLIAKRVQQKNEALAKIATHDTLTGLPNRLFLRDLLERELVQTAAEKMSEETKSAKEGCLFVVDLDKFKAVNDSFGHTAGDKLLIEVSQRLSKLLDSSQVLVRMGGDEFIIWAPDMTLDNSGLLAKKIEQQCNAPVMINNLAVQTGASIGIAHYPSHAKTAEMLIVSADTAMYKAKQHLAGYEVFNEPDSEKYKTRLRLRTDIPQALEREEFELYYQPKVELSTGKIIGVEALSRWHHPSEGVLSPAVFLELIEDSGRVQEFGRYVLKHSIRQIARWQQQDIALPVAVNLSPYNLLDPGLIEFIKEQLDENAVKACQLEIELTENETSLNISSIRSSLSRLKELGVMLAIDDFGTGMSSLAYIAELDVDIIKIDRTFVSDMTENKKHQAIIATALTLATSFHSKMVAEGIETSEQARMLLAMGCDYGQGFLYSKPLTIDALTAVLQAGSRLEASR